MIPREWRRALGRFIVAVLPPCNFLVLHYAYFIVTPLICSAIFWGSSTSARSMTYVDSLFMCVSAMTGAGLNSVDLSSLSSFQQSILLALLILGHAFLISITVLFVRNRAFHSKFEGISKNRASQWLARYTSEFDLSPNPRIRETPINLEDHENEPANIKDGSKANITAQPVLAEASSLQGNDDHIRWADDGQLTIGARHSHHNHHSHRVFPMVGVGARLDLNNHPRNVSPNLPLYEEEKPDGLKGIFRGTQKYLTSRGSISRNSSFHGLTPDERDELGGVEYKAVSFLSVIVPIYWLSFLGLLVLYVLMMYVSAFPVLVTMRNTNVYEERSLGVYSHDESVEETNSKPPNFFLSLFRHHILGWQDLTTTEGSRSYFVHQQLRSQLSHDIWWIVMAVLFITIAESPHYQEDPVGYSTFNIIFEVVSAYGCVGVSVGYPGTNSSFCGSWHTISKLILAAVTLRGRHRGLPVVIDRAVMLPNESLAYAEEDAVLRREQTRTYGMDKMPRGSV